MKTIIVYDHFIALGGAENVSLLLASKLGAQIETAYADNELFSKEIMKKSIVSKGIKEKNGPINSAFLAIYFWLFYSIPKCNAIIVSGLYSPLALWRKKKSQVNIVYFHMFPTFLNWNFGRLKENYGFLAALIYLFFTKGYASALRRSVKKADTVFCNSMVTKQLFSQLGIQTSILYPPVDTSNFNFEGDANYFLSTARLEESKRIDVVARVFAELPMYNIKFVGSGSLFEKLEAKYRNCENISFLGWCTPDQISTYYAKCKALIYIPKNEAFGIAPIEALAAGKRVLGVAEAGIKETIINRDLGTLISSPVSGEELKLAIIAMAVEEDDLNKVRSRQKYAEQFGLERFVSRIRAALGLTYE